MCLGELLWWCWTPGVGVSTVTIVCIVTLSSGPPPALVISTAYTRLDISTHTKIYLNRPWYIYCLDATDIYLHTMQCWNKTEQLNRNILDTTTCWNYCQKWSYLTYPWEDYWNQINENVKRNCSAILWLCIASVMSWVPVNLPWQNESVSCQSHATSQNIVKT